MARGGTSESNESPCSVSLLQVAEYRRLWSEDGGGPWGCLFMLPPWIEPWLEHFAGGRQVHILKIADQGKLLGLAPLLVKGREASLIGSADVCDYIDFIVGPGRQERFFAALINHLRREGIEQLNLGPLRPDSAALACCAGSAAQLGLELTLAEDEVSYELALPADWDGYLAGLTVQQRHEVRRKLRRLGEAGRYSYRTVSDPAEVEQKLGVFLHLFTISRPDKKAFMTTTMQAFFTSLTKSLAACGLLRLGFLDIDGAPAAAVLCFEYRDTVYLYNSGFDPRYRHLNAGLLCKVLSVGDSIEGGKKVYDFLKGDEIYKQRLGGRPVQLERCRVQL